MTQKWWYNFKTTNKALPGIAAPSIVPGVGAGAITSAATARYYGTKTALKWTLSGFRGATLKGAAAAGAANFAKATVAFEGGVAIGSAISAFGFSDCPCK